MSLEKELKKAADVVIVGAGPIGLAHAWAIKKLNPKLNVVVLEKYSKFQRTHTLVMEYDKLEQLIKATDAQNVPEFSNLVAQLKKDPNIRTNHLQEFFKARAEALGVKILIEELNPDTAQQQILKECPKAQLIIGADGTHSIVSQTFYPPGNQVKHEFDYVLQLRLEIKGEHKSSYLSTAKFYQMMFRKGLIANEYVGNFADGKTPITMQMMISKENFEELKAATSKNPKKPFSVLGAEHPISELPSNLQAFINEYLNLKIKKTHEEGQYIDRESITVSVNEAPATHAKEVTITKKKKASFVLVGDAGLGLSYFKGLNAGLESTAKLITQLRPTIENSFVKAQQTQEALATYQEWFLQDFSPRKIAEVQSYSTWRIRSAMATAETVRKIKAFSAEEDQNADERDLLDAYFNLFDQELGETRENEWYMYPHREYDLVKFAQLSYVPVKHHLIKTAKLFVDYIKPYKSPYQISQDFKLPIVGLVNLLVGLIKLLQGLFTFNGSKLVDGFFGLLRGTLEAITFPLNWILKPITRGFITLITGYKKIEDNSGIQTCTEQGENLLTQLQTQGSSPKKLYELLAVCHDLHRKVDKAQHRGQTTATLNKERSLYKALKVDDELNLAKAKAYLSLFKKKPQQPEATADNFLEELTV
ncbi:MAG: hypothetical protein EPN84_04735 [Legionella sp.]|nr:MAG: hypothetical protein EPN84_04735 [Legionella sp.]